MSLLLPAVIANAPRHPFVIIESSVSQSGLPILRAILNRTDVKGHVLLFSFLYPPQSLVDDPAREELRVFDRTDSVPGYADHWTDPSEYVLNHVKQAPQGPLTVVIDSADTVCADRDSPSKTYALVASILSLTRARPSSRVILHLVSPTPVLPLLLPPRLSPTVTHITAHPPVILTHLALAHLMPPPPATPAVRFFRVFLPLAARAWEVERLVFGADGPGSGGCEFAAEVLVRAPGVGEKRRAMERVLEGWTALKGPVRLEDLESLRKVWVRKVPEEGAPPDPTQNLSFNLNLTPKQQQSRAQVPLPYIHEGEAPDTHPSNSSGAIYYDIDSADDIDDDDPDEDLDI